MLVQVKLHQATGDESLLGFFLEEDGVGIDHLEQEFEEVLDQQHDLHSEGVVDSEVESLEEQDEVLFASKDVESL